MNPSPATRVFSPATQPAEAFPRWVPVVAAVGAVPGWLLAGHEGGLAILGSLGLGLCMLCGCAVASWVDLRVWHALSRRSGAASLAGALVFCVASFPVTLLLTALLAALTAFTGLGSVLAPTGLVTGLWLVGAATGSLTTRFIDVGVSGLVKRFRTRLVLAILLLLVLVGFLTFMLAVGTNALVDRLVAGKLNLTVDTPNAMSAEEASAMVGSFVAENRADVTSMLALLGALLCLPAITSAAGKLADAVMERIGPLKAALDAVARGERHARLEAGGSEDFQEVAQHFNAMVEGLRVAQNMEQAFGSYVSPEVMAAIKAQHGNADLPASLRQASVMFSDIRGFTTLSEALPPQQVVAVLNRYLSAMVDVVGAHQGYLDKFIGDAVVVVFNGPVDQPDHAQRAVACAVSMLRTLEDMNAQHRFPELGAELAIGLGIATGPMVCGNIGGTQKRQYTVIGDTVNLASRVEGMTKTYGARLLITQPTVDALPAGRFELRQVDRVAVKGKKEAVTVVEVLDGLPSAQRDTRLATRAAFLAGCHALAQGNLEPAEQELDRVVRASPDDAAAVLMLERTRELRVSGLPEGWDGSVALKSK